MLTQFRDDVLRVLAALETGGMCPEDWCAGCATLDPTRALVYTRWCEAHQPGVGGAEDERVTRRDDFSLHASSEGDSVTCRAFAEAVMGRR